MTDTPLSGTVPTVVRWDQVIPTTGAYLYRIYDEDDTLLYVGVTERLRTRLRSHARGLPGAHRATFTRYGSRVDAEAAECAAITAEHPLLNVAVGTGRYGSTVGPA